MKEERSGSEVWDRGMKTVCVGRGRSGERKCTGEVKEVEVEMRKKQIKKGGETKEERSVEPNLI